MFGAVKRRSGKLAQEKLPRCFSRRLWPELRRKYTCSNQGEQRQPTTHLPATLHLRLLDTALASQVPAILCVKPLPDAHRKERRQYGKNPEFGRATNLFFLLPAEEFHGN